MTHTLFLISVLIQVWRISCHSAPESLCQTEGGSFQLINDTDRYLFYDDHEQMLYLDGSNYVQVFTLECQNETSRSEVILNPFQLRNSNDGFNREAELLECPGVCSIKAIVISQAVDNSVCNFTDDQNDCDLKKLNDLKASRSTSISGRIIVPSIEPEHGGFSQIITYSIMDPIVGEWVKCDEIDEDGNVATVGLHSEDGNKIKSLDCPVNDNVSTERPAIIRIEKTRKKEKCVGLPILCPKTPEEPEQFKPEYSFISAKITKDSIKTWSKEKIKAKMLRKKIMIGSIVGVLSLLVIALAGCLIYIRWKKYKKNEIESYHPKFYVNGGYPKDVFTGSTVITDSTNPSNGYVMHDFNELVDYFDPNDDYWKANDTSEEAVKARKKIISRQLSGDPDKLNPTMTLNQQIKLLSYNDKHEISRTNFTIGQLLGYGNFGSVYEGNAAGLFHPGSETKVAIKTVNDAFDGLQITALISEIKILGHLDLHLNLVNMMGSCKTQLAHEGQLWLLLEYCSEGDMKSFLIKHREEFISSITNKIPVNGLDERLILKWAYDIAKGKNLFFLP